MLQSLSHSISLFF